MRHTKQSMRVITITHQPRNHSTLTLLVIALLTAVIIAALFSGRVHGADGMQPVQYIPAVSVGGKPEPTVIPSFAITAVPPTATPQPEIGEPPIVGVN